MFSRLENRKHRLEMLEELTNVRKLRETQGMHYLSPRSVKFFKCAPQGYPLSALRTQRILKCDLAPQQFKESCCSVAGHHHSYCAACCCDTLLSYSHSSSSLVELYTYPQPTSPVARAEETRLFDHSCKQRRHAVLQLCPGRLLPFSHPGMHASITHWCKS